MEPAIAGDDDLGLLDLVDLAEERFTTLRDITQRITDEIENLGSRTQERTREMGSLRESSPGDVDRRQARTLIERAAGDMDQFVAGVRAQLPLFRETLQSGADAVARAATITIDDMGGDRQRLRSTRDDLRTFEASLGGAYDSTAGFRQIIAGLPRMTSTLNRAKRETTKVLEEVLESMAAGRRILQQAISTLDGALGDDC